jgi:NAD(P)-dependent dehydrogenase (short-subunit alcohol dehydrogenase family)
MATKISSMKQPSSGAYIITGPTSGIGRATAFKVAKHGTVVLAGRNREKLNETQAAIGRSGGRSVCVVCDLSDIRSVRRAAAEIIDLHLPLTGPSASRV